MPDGRTSCPGEIAPMGGCPHGGTVSTFGRYKSQHSTCRTPESRGLGGRGNGAAAQKESAPIHRKSMVKPRRAAATDCQGPGRSPVCGGGVGLPPFRGHRGTARVPESPTRTPPPQSRYIGLPQDHPLRRTYFASGGPQPARPPDRPSPSAAAASRAEPLHFRSFDIPRRMSTHTPWRQPDGGAMDLPRLCAEQRHMGAQVCPHPYEALYHYPKGRPRRLFERRGPGTPIFVAREFGLSPRDARLKAVGTHASVIPTLAMLNVPLAERIEDRLRSFGIQRILSGTRPGNLKPTKSSTFSRKTPISETGSGRRSSPAIWEFTT